MEKTQWEEAIRCGAVGCFAIQHYNTLLLGEGCEEEEKRKMSGRFFSPHPFPEGSSLIINANQTIFREQFRVQQVSNKHLIRNEII